MKKFLALFAMVACFGFTAKSQTVIANLLIGQSSYYLIDDLCLGDQYKTTQMVNLPIGFYMLNDGESTITTTDSVKISFTMNNMSYTIVASPKTDWEKDSMWLVSINLQNIPISEQYFNFAKCEDSTTAQYLNIVTTKIAFVNNTAINDEGFSGAFGIYAIDLDVSETSIEKIAVYPNPVRDMLHIDNANNVNVSIYAANGQLVKQINEVNGSMTVNMSEMSNGLYFVKIQNENATRVEKIQVIR